MRGLLVVAAVALVAIGAPDTLSLRFLPDANLTNPAVDFGFRYCSAEYHPTLISKSLVWTSASVDAKIATTEQKAEADVMIGLGGLPNAVNLPLLILASGHGEAALKVNFVSFLNNLFNNGKLDVSFSAGAVGIAALCLREFRSDHTSVIQPVRFFLPMSDPICREKDMSGDEGNLTGLSCSFIPTGKSANVTVTYVASKKAGIMEYGYSPVSPRTLEMIIEIADYPLEDPTNYLRLDFGIISASTDEGGVVDRNGYTIQRKKMDMDDLYVGLSTHAVVNGERVEVETGISNGERSLLSGDILTALKGAFGAKFNVHLATVNFPQGASSFVYDPCVGVGANIYKASASTTALSFLVVLFSAIMFLF